MDQWIVMVVLFTTLVIGVKGPNTETPGNIDKDIKDNKIACGYTEQQVDQMSGCMKTLKEYEEKLIKAKTSILSSSKEAEKEYCAARWKASTCLLQHTTNCRNNPKNDTTMRMIGHLEAVIVKIPSNERNPVLKTNLVPLKTSLNTFKTSNDQMQILDSKTKMVQKLAYVVGACETNYYSFCC